ncbi:MAG: plasmid stabilization protein [Actinophytocola sp.]|uniref:type II toxin-antitoxin system RelE family toxin n=1 Tax=Actinophytocola sp. TaxID=1872138 RepID=UPI001324AC55|nr:type II toxin-antitoxin system RelE/ParE family toxin [Actinophytocola sp.]MPZ84833.1 plasmid stabilization protein [Actinophytocola sp.]
MSDSYSIEFRRSAEKALAKLDGRTRARILRNVAALADDPRPTGVKSLTGEHGLWRIRVGDYRVVYEIRDNELLVLVIRVAHRREVYRKH